MPCLHNYSGGCPSESPPQCQLDATGVWEALQSELVQPSSKSNTLRAQAPIFVPLKESQYDRATLLSHRPDNAKTGELRGLHVAGVLPGASRPVEGDVLGQGSICPRNFAARIWWWHAERFDAALREADAG